MANCTHLGGIEVVEPPAEVPGCEEATGHPVMRSAEPGQSWRWCYVDELTEA